MDCFERFLICKICEFENRLKENEGNKEVEWSLNLCLEEFLNILSEYNLNYKFEIGAQRLY